MKGRFCIIGNAYKNEEVLEPGSTVHFPDGKSIKALTALPGGKCEVATALFKCHVCLSLSVCTSLMSRPAVYPLLKTYDYARICNFEV